MREVNILNINEIKPNRSQPRLDFDDESIKALSSSIKENGLIHPIVVRKMDDGYEIIAGERRYRASSMLGKDTIEAIIIDHFGSFLL